MKFAHHDLKNRNSAAESEKKTKTKKTTLPLILPFKIFWSQVAGVPTFLNVIDVMTVTSSQNGAIKCM